MDPINWTGALGGYINPIFQFGLISFLSLTACYFVATFASDEELSDVALAHTPFARTKDWTIGSATGLGELLFPAISLALICWGLNAALSEVTLTAWLGSTGMPAWLSVVLHIIIFANIGLVLTYAIQRLPSAFYAVGVRWGFNIVIVSLLIYFLIGMLLPTGDAGIVGAISARLIPVWAAMAVVFAVSIVLKRRLGLYGKLFDSPIGMVGFAIVLFWIFTAIFADTIATFPPLEQIAQLKNKLPGSPVPEGSEGALMHYLLGGDNLGRDVFSRVVLGSRSVLVIAPPATVFAFMVGVTLGVPAGYYGGRYDTSVSFLANMVLSFPVILLFYLLVTPEIRETGIPMYLAAVLFLFPIIFVVVLINSRYFTQPLKRNIMVGITLVLGLWAYSGLAFNADPLGVFSMSPNLLNIFVAVVFVNSPTVFRIVRGLVMDIKTRDYVAAAQTRGEGPWYVMLWEILPNARGPLIVDFCLRIGYTTILLGTLGFFGLGVSSESADWGSTINDGRKLISIFPHPALPPALALMSLVLGLNLLADGLREESLKD